MVVRKTSAEGTEKVKEKPRKKKEKSAGQGIQSFFPKIDPNDRRTPEAAKVPADEDLETQETQSTSQPPPKRLISRKRKAPTLKVVEPPTFHPVRASIPDSSFLHHLKAREFVLRCNSPRIQILTNSRESIYSQTPCPRKTHCVPRRSMRYPLAISDKTSFRSIIQNNPSRFD